MIRAVVVDDEPPARRKLKHLLAEENDITIAGEAGSGAEAIEVLRNVRPDVAFLDVQLPDCTGFDVAAELPEEFRPQIIFVTAHDQFALQAFEVHAVDYLLKPVEPSRFRRSLQRIRERMQDRHPASADDLARTIRAQPGYSKKLLIEEKGRSLFLEPETVEWLEAARNYVCLYARGRTYVVRGSLEAFASKLDRQMFCRISRSEIVNTHAIAEVHALSHGDQRLILKSGKQLRWSRRYRNSSTD